MLTPHAFRLTLGTDLKSSILAYVQQQDIKAGSLLSCVGCLSHASIRLANESESLELAGPLEILTLSGTLTPEHVHLHISVADKSGRVYGGHLQEGSMVSYTAEVCLAEYTDLSFTREPDATTGFTELVVR
ncbi:PPC domain-containing DNA-binding protein [Photobacterium sp. DNB23_23_1]|uniref:DNA-binding protein n=1 Tax=Photobacterium pectinilyticum TaxID=2906793 RepID=A0ABT1N523_9GAMM|nr:PPC domain-containing DNA-binding protein [Photobacterium sp. ZSDE20]MCQ1059853.1 DNA-binding protein [Photobacterium sp. ZSDE20]MDD1826446.1 DNA-binding protein [Photobacterium sp. ZSDE20]